MRSFQMPHNLAFASVFEVFIPSVGANFTSAKNIQIDCN